MLRTVDSLTLCCSCPKKFLAAFVNPLSTAYHAIFALVSSSYEAYSPRFLFVSVFNKMASTASFAAWTKLASTLHFPSLGSGRPGPKEKFFLKVYFTSLQP